MKTWKDIISENNDNYIQITFHNKQSFYDALEVLQDNDFHPSTNAHRGRGYYTEDTQHLNITIKESLFSMFKALLNKNNIKFNTKSIFPSFKIIDRGGHLD